jgi:voltage-gated potassium channel
MQYDDELFKRFDKLKIRLFEKEVVYKEKRAPQPYQVILFGYHHGGHEFIRIFKELKKRFLVIDYDPDVIDILETQKVPFIYGDANDLELLKEAQIEKAKMVITTITDHKTNMFIVNLLAQENPDAVIVCHADNIAQATELYDAGASSVMIPHHIGSERMGAFIKRAGVDKNEFEKHRKKHLATLQAHIDAGAVAVSHESKIL